MIPTRPARRFRVNTVLLAIIAGALFAALLIFGTGYADAQPSPAPNANHTSISHAGADPVAPQADCEPGAIDTIYAPNDDGVWVFTCIYPTPINASGNPSPAPNQ